MKQVFLESHNIKNLCSGLGQFNYHLIKGFYECAADDFKFIVHAKNIKGLKAEFGDFFKYQPYFSITRYRYLRLPNKYTIWHSMNQNTKVEPRFEMPYVLTIHDVHFAEEQDSDEKASSVKRFKEKLKRANAIVYISKYAQKATHRHFDTLGIPEYIIYNGNPMADTSIPENYKPELKISGPYLFTIGEFVPRKNFHVLLEMLKYLPNYKLIIAGNSDRPYLQKINALITELSLEDRVFIPGKISETEKKYHLKNCEAFVFPTLKEGFGIPIIEALSYSTAVITSNNTSLPEVGRAFATYWEHYEPKYMAQKVLEGIDRFQDQEFVENAKKHAQSFSWKNTAKQYLEVYNDILQ